jgi:hypothetical protein
MSTYCLATTDRTVTTFHAASDAEACRLARHAAKATGKAVQYIRRFDGTYGRSLPFGGAA